LNRRFETGAVFDSLSATKMHKLLLVDLKHIINYRLSYRTWRADFAIDPGSVAKIAFNIQKIRFVRVRVRRRTYLQTRPCRVEKGYYDR